MNKNVPDFFVPGVPKAGTTSLFHYLNEHPNICAPKIKEPHYFVHSKISGRAQVCVTSLQEYNSLYKKTNSESNLLMCDASAFYFFYSELAIPNIIDLAGKKKKIIIVLRNPIQRAYSAFKYTSALNAKESLCFFDAIHRELKDGDIQKYSPMFNYVGCGLYADRLNKWIAAFNNVHVILFDDLVKNTRNAVSEVFDFLGVDSSIPITPTAHNVGGGVWRNRRAGMVVKKLASPKLRSFGKKLMPRAYLCLKKQIMQRGTFVPPPIGDKEKELLTSLFRKDVAKTGTILKRDLSFWLD